MPSSRSFFLFGLLFCIVMLTGAAYFQFIEHLEPCPLCILQRLAALLTAVILLLAVLHNPKGWGVKWYGIVAGGTAVVGAVISARHVWLQNLPAEQVPSCGPGLNFMLDHFPLSETINMVFHGSGECAEVLWKWLGLTIPAWTLLAFILLALLCFWQVFRSQTIDYDLGYIRYH